MNEVLIYLVNFSAGSSYHKKKMIAQQVYVGDVYCGDVTYGDGIGVYEIDCGGAVGRTISVKQPYNILTLCEVQAFGEPSDEVPLRNVADGELLLFHYTFNRMVTKMELCTTRPRAQ